MKVSIITVAFNSSSTIKDTIDSILNQKYDEIEYIIVDGLSKDNTVDIIKSYENKFKGSNKTFKWISEKDSGLYDAMNKGIDMASGEIVGILNSDDFYIDNNVISDVVDFFKEKNTDSVYSDLVFIDSQKNNKVTRIWESGERKGFKTGWHPAHPTLFIKKEVYNKYGVFNLKYKLGSDYELMLRFFEKYKISSTYLNRKIVKMRIGGESTKSIKNILKNNLENYDAWKINELNVSPFTFPLKIFNKIKQLKLT